MAWEAVLWASSPASAPRIDLFLRPCAAVEVICAPFMGKPRWVIGWAMVGRAEFAPGSRETKLGRAFGRGEIR